MKLTLERDVLAEAVQAVAPAAAKAPHIAALAGVRIDVDLTDAGVATFAATDLDFAIDHVVDGITAGEDEEGTAIVSAKLLGRLVAALPPGPVHLDATTDGHVLHVSAGETHAQLHRYLDDAWPEVPEVDGDAVTLEERQLTELRAVMHAASSDDARPLLTCLHLGDRRVFATDSYRVAVADLGVDVPEVALPAQPFAQVLKKAGDHLTLVAGTAGHIQLATGQTTWTLTPPASAEKVPKPDAFLAMKRPHHITCNRDALVEAVQRVRVIGEEGDPVRLTVEGDKLTVERRHQDVGEIVDVLPCSGGWAGRIAFNPAYLLDVLANVEDATFDLALGEGTTASPTNLKPVCATTGRGRHLMLMPVRVP